MDFNLKIFEGTDSIKFGMTSEEIQIILKAKPELFKKTVVNIYDTESYYDTCHVYYEKSKNGKLISSAFEFFKPSKVFLDQVQLIGVSKQKIEDFFKSRFEDCEIETYRLSSPKNAIGCSFNEKFHFQSLSITRKGLAQEQGEFYKKAFEDKYSISEEKITDIDVRKHLCPKCMNMFTAKKGSMCPNCKVLML